MAPERRTVEVCADWDGLAGPTLVGRLHAALLRGKELFSFEYDAGWLESGRGQSLDPAPGLHRGPQHPAKGKESFGLFLDDDAELASPPWTSLRELEQASLRLERAKDDRAPAVGRWLRMLIAAGRSLGGARPKASVLDGKGALWIAKFPATSDAHDVGAWEGVVGDLAREAGVTTAQARVLKLGSRHHTFLSRRFDRTDGGARLHFASAMTLLERGDGDEGASYLELARILVQQGAHPTRDLEQLWRRIAFFVCVSNVDDHLRNHGFLLQPSGWALAPAYDVNPVATGDGLTLNVSETDNAQDLGLVRSVASQFRVAGPRSAAILEEVTSAVRGWRRLAKRAGLSRGEQDRMAPAFRLAGAGR